MVRRLKVIYVQTVNGEKHYIIKSLESNENPANSEDFDETTAIRTMKKEASRPILLLREE